MMSNLDFGGDQNEFWPEMPRTVHSNSETELLVGKILDLREKGVTTQMAADFIGCPRGTLRNWAQRRALPPEWMAKKLREELDFYPL